MKTKIGSKLLLLICAGSLAHSAYSDGYRVPPPTAEGIAKSGINRVFVDDASAISYNPANLTDTKGASIVLSTAFAQVRNTYENPLGATYESQDDWLILPNFYASMPIGDNGVAIGLGVTTPFGQGIEWNPGDVYNPFAPISLYKAEIKYINFNPTVAFKLGEKISVGVGANIVYSELTFDAVTSTNAPPPAIPGPSSGSADATGDDIGYGVNFGVTWDFVERQRLIFTYRSEVTLDYEGSLNASGLPLSSSSFGLEIKYPTIIGLGYGFEVTDNFRLEANLEWLEWSVNETQSADLGANGVLAIPQNWNDTFTFGISGDWQFAENWTLYSGWAYIETPIPDESLAPILPDTDRHALSLGLGYQLGGHGIDLSYTLSLYEERTTTSGTYDIDSDLIGLTYSYSF